ncbi:hypothetical protein [Buttiauxella sp.]|uniref:hypothetical protein n=1 Tax=Buttiauxella sp. TaxID=1972222 RepID=UPI003C77D55C
MKHRMLFIMIFFFFSLYSRLSFSGSPGGLFLVVVPMTSGVVLKDNIDSYFKKHYGVDNELSPTCDITFGKIKSRMRTSVDVFYLKTKPHEINNQLLEGTLKNKKYINRLSSIIGGYKDELVKGFDGILFYELVNNYINLYSLSSIDKSKGINKSTLLVDDVVDDVKLGQAICKVIVELPTPAP